MTDVTASQELREQAIALRRAGKSRREIKDVLAITSNRTLGDALRGEPPPPWTRRPNAKDDLRAKARAGAIAYWCEGTKNKPYRRRDRVSFMNSDPALIQFFLRFLAVAGVRREILIFRVHIHEGADAGAAQRYWLNVTEADAAQFRRPALKRHNPKPMRKNIAEGYHGCLRVEVRRSAELYHRIEGWASAAMTGPGLKADSCLGVPASSAPSAAAAG